MGVRQRPSALVRRAQAAEGSASNPCPDGSKSDTAADCQAPSAQAEQGTVRRASFMEEPPAPISAVNDEDDSLPGGYGSPRQSVEDLRGKAFSCFMEALSSGQLEGALDDAVGQGVRAEVPVEARTENAEDGSIDSLRNKAFSQIIASLNSGELEQAMQNALGSSTSEKEQVEMLKSQVQLLTTTLAQMARENEFLRREIDTLRGTEDNASQHGSGSALHAIRNVRRDF